MSKRERKWCDFTPAEKAASALLASAVGSLRDKSTSWCFRKSPSEVIDLANRGNLTKSAI